MRASRWSDHDTYLGPLTYARDHPSHRPLSIVLDSGGEEYPGASLRLRGFGHTLIVALPQWALRPYREKVKAKSWDAATVERLGRDWYWRVDEREYGFNLLDGHFSVMYGRQAMDSSIDRTWGWFLPWTQWRHVRRSFYGLNGEHVATLSSSEAFVWEQAEAAKEATPTASFKFKDFDGEEIVATTMIEEREWRFGTGWFKWLSAFRKPRISRTLDLRFSAEVGEEKGSWKGGTLGHGIEMRSAELHEAAFRRYCDENGLTFVGVA